jgi:hypothetical protein
VLGAPVLHEPAAAQLKALPAAPRDRLCPGAAFALEALLRRPQAGPPSPAACQRPGQLSAPRRAEAFVLGGVDPLRLASTSAAISS